MESLLDVVASIPYLFGVALAGVAYSMAAGRPVLARALAGWTAASGAGLVASALAFVAGLVLCPSVGRLVSSVLSIEDPSEAATLLAMGVSVLLNTAAATAVISLIGLSAWLALRRHGSPA